MFFLLLPEYFVIYAQSCWCDRLEIISLALEYFAKMKCNLFFPSARDESEVAMCIKDLNAPGFYPSMISIWLVDSFERKDVERELLTKLLINLTKSQDGLLSQTQLVRG